jgi:hypothetical protein
MNVQFVTRIVFGPHSPTSQKENGLAAPGTR